MMQRIFFLPMPQANEDLTKLLQKRDQWVYKPIIFSDY
jgi:hypothetical protein